MSAPGGSFATITSEEALARVERALDAIGLANAAVATDGDGTLWTHDVGEALFDAVLEAGMVREPAYEALSAEARAHGVDATGDAATIARTLFEAYVARRYPEDRMCAAMAWCMAGTSATELLAFAREMLERSFRLRARLIAESNGLVRALSRRGLPVFLVSASPRAVVEAAAAIVAEETGIPLPPVVAMTPRVVDGVIAPATEGVWPYGPGKVEGLAQVLAGRTLVVALGDNVFDVPMLKSARVPLAIRPKPALAAAAHEVPGLSRLST